MFTILQDISIALTQYPGRSKPHEKNFPSYWNCLVGNICSYMQGNNYGLLVKTIKKCPKSPNGYIRPATPVLTFRSSTKFAVRAVGAVWINIRRVKLQHYGELTMFRFYFPLFMVFLRVIFKSVCYLCAAFWVILIAMFCYMFVWRQQAQRKKIAEETTNNQ